MRNLLIGAAVTVLMGLTLISLGLHTTADTAEYMAMARGLAAGKGAIGFDGQPGGIWTPAYSLLLVPGVMLGIDPYWWAIVVNIILYGVLVTVVGRSLLSNLNHSVWRATLGVALVASAPVLTVTTSFLGDLLFLVIFALAMGAAESLVTMRSQRWLILGILTAAAPLVKPQGLAIWPVAVLAVAFSNISVSFRRRVFHTIGFGTLVLTPALVLMGRNLRLFGHPFEPFPAPIRNSVDIFRCTLEEGSRWWIPQIDSTDVLLIMAGLAVMISVWRWRRHRLELPQGIWVWVAGASGMLLALWIGSAFQRVDTPNHRLLAPVFLAGWVVVSRLGDRGHGRVLSTRLSKSLALAWMVLTATTGLGALHNHILAGSTARMTYDSQEAHDLHAWFGDSATTELVLSNVPEYVYWHTGSNAQWTSPGVVSAYRKGVDGRLLLVWFDDANRPFMLGPEDLGEWFEVTQTSRGLVSSLYELIPLNTLTD